MKLEILRGVIIAGQFVYPNEEKPTIVEVAEKEARQLVNTGKAKLAEKGAKVTKKLLSQQEVDELAEIKAEQAAAEKL